MKKFVLLVLIVALFLQTPFYKTMLVPEYKKFEAVLANLLYSNPQDTRVKRLGPTDPALGPTIRLLQPSQQLPETDLNSFMPKKTKGGVSKSEPQVPYVQPKKYRPSSN